MKHDDRIGQATILPAFPELLGIKLMEVSAEKVVGQMLVTEALANRNGVLHGGALISLADTLGGTGAVMNLPPGKTTTTIESKTNFLRAIPLGQIATGTSLCLHAGRTTSLWQTTIVRPDGKPAAIVTQTQVVIDWRA
ncbi:PaaI family thioesterase [Pseudotabrizicola sp. 4114]|uniref:PaaI family thioesterase n=1 Tax=Pseudotabrizicola sp. 4114 TaxID=2817731 RepID=UPI002865B2EF|nr:uncharacterized protein (TIGR00369 family) [Pseudorhodobacter sp. 4114]